MIYMNFKMTMKLAILTILITTLLTACAPKGSVDKNAEHVALQIAQLNFDPNTRPLTAENTKRAAIFLQQFYDLGRKDHSNNLAKPFAQERVSQLKNAEVFSSSSQGSTFVSQQYKAEQPKEQAALLLKSATETYWDGYNGKP